MNVNRRAEGEHSVVRLTTRGRIVIRRITLAITISVSALVPASRVYLAQEKQEPVDVLIVGAGIAGLSAALEAARGGASVLVVDMSTVGGGHAILSNAAVSIIGTPLQEQKKIADSSALAEKDFLARGEDNDPRWVAAYVRDSREWLYDWLTDLGVSFESLVRPAGNSVPRLHLARGKGLGLVEPIYRACLRHPNIRFQWAALAEDLIIGNGHGFGSHWCLNGWSERDQRRELVKESTRV
jgi:predicted oxidoreductase